MTVRQWLIIAASVLAMGAGSVAAYYALRPAAPRFHAIDVTGAPWGRDFALTDHRGRRAALADFRAQAPNEHGAYTVDHSAQAFVFDRAGRLRLVFKHDAPSETIAADLRALLGEPS